MAGDAGIAVTDAPTRLRAVALPAFAAEAAAPAFATRPPQSCLAEATQDGGWTFLRPPKRAPLRREAQRFSISPSPCIPRSPFHCSAALGVFPAAGAGMGKPSDPRTSVAAPLTVTSV